jgi:hypothetical protein
VDIFQAAAGSAAPKGPPLGDLPVTIYQYKICPFCCKVKAVLDFFKVPYETLDVNPLTKVSCRPIRNAALEICGVPLRRQVVA